MKFRMKKFYKCDDIITFDPSVLDGKEMGVTYTDPDGSIIYIEEYNGEVVDLTKNDPDFNRIVDLLTKTFGLAAIVHDPDWNPIG